jgi:hypothetical protein
MTCLVERRALRHRRLYPWHASTQAVLGGDLRLIVLESGAGHVAHHIGSLPLLDRVLSRGILPSWATGRKKMQEQRQKDIGWATGRKEANAQSLPAADRMIERSALDLLTGSAKAD